MSLAFKKIQFFASWITKLIKYPRVLQSWQSTPLINSNSQLYSIKHCKLKPWIFKWQNSKNCKPQKLLNFMQFKLFWSFHNLINKEIFLTRSYFKLLFFNNLKYPENLFTSLKFCYLSSLLCSSLFHCFMLLSSLILSL